VTCSLNATSAFDNARRGVDEDPMPHARRPRCDALNEQLGACCNIWPPPGCSSSPAEHTPPSCQSGIARGDSPGPPLSNAGCDVP
jgi:hypothetical protein